MRWEKSELLLGLARHLAASSDGLTLDEMAREVGAERRTAERMRNAIREIFPQMEEIVDGRTKRFRIPGGLDGFMQAPSADELAELDIAIRQLAGTGQDARADLLRSLDTKIRAALRAAARRRLEPDLEALLAAEALAMQAGPRPRLEPETLMAIREALKSRRVLHFRYGAAARIRQVEPWGLLFGRLSYLVGPAPRFEKPVLWRLDRRSRSRWAILVLARPTTSASPNTPPNRLGPTRSLRRMSNSASAPTRPAKPAVSSFTQTSDSRRSPTDASWSASAPAACWNSSTTC